MSSIRPFREILRRKTKKIKVGNVYVGGDAPISVQSMTNTLQRMLKQPYYKLTKLLKQVLILLEFLVQMKSLQKH
jgi:(E)-4-hydroxy-3-methylbut-2-enyl-diphosphate synthase